MQGQHNTANETSDEARFRLAHDERTGRWLVIEVGLDRRGVQIPARFFGPYDNEIAARIQVTTLQRQLKEAAFRRRLEQLADA